MAEKKISFFSKEGIPCPICSSVVFKEELLTGRGRLIAKNLTKELRREYEPIPESPLVAPFMYSITTCPSCLLSLFNADWGQIKFPPDSINYLKEQTGKRNQLVNNLFKTDFPFNQNKTPLSAAGSYYLALASYGAVTSKYSPSVKMAIASIRFYWLVGDFLVLYPETRSYWESVYSSLKNRTFGYLDIAYNKVLKQEEDLNFFGPDTDRNNGFQGLVYLHHYFQFLTMPKDNPISREQISISIKRDLSRVFGMGKPSKQMPSAILELVRELYDTVKQELSDLNSSYDEEM